MSAFAVSDTHIRYIVSALLQYGAIRLEGAPRVAGELVVENARSVHHRYPRDASGPLEVEPHADLAMVVGSRAVGLVADVYEGRVSYGEAIARLHVGPPLTMAQITKAIDCYEYQSCEHPGWTASKAAALINDLRTRLLRCGEPSTWAPVRGDTDRNPGGSFWPPCLPAWEAATWSL